MKKMTTDWNSAQEIIENVREARQAIYDSRFDWINGPAKQTVLCPIDKEDECNKAVYKLGFTSWLTIVASPLVPEGRLFVFFDEELTWKPVSDRIFL